MLYIFFTDIQSIFLINKNYVIILIYLILYFNKFTNEFLNNLNIFLWYNIKKYF